MKFYQTSILLLIIVIILLLVEPHLPKAGHHSHGKKGGKDTISIIHQRKSVRMYLDKAVEEEKLMELVKAGMAAPTARDKRPWKFIVVTGKENLQKLAKYKRADLIAKAGAAIVVAGVPSKFLDGQAADYWIQDCSAATQNILLAAEAMGLGAVWTGAWPSKEASDNIKKILNLDADTTPLNVVAIGYPTGKEKPKDKFDPKDVQFIK
jgi:nitroreductase